VVVNQYAVHPLASGISTHDDIVSRDWITQNMLGVSEFSDNMAMNFTGSVRSRFKINDRYNKAFYINPGKSTFISYSLSVILVICIFD
jgi:hypothetical protein